MITDSLSRDSPQETEWSLNKQSFEEVLNFLPNLEVDLFATALNAKLPCYVTPDIDPRAIATDVFFNRLEQVDEHLPVSPDKHFVEGSPETENIQGGGSPSGSPLAQQSLVPDPRGSKPIPGPSNEPSTITGDQRREDLRILLSDIPPLYLDYLTKTLGRSFSKQNVEIMRDYLQPFSQAQYNSAWSKWISFLVSLRPPTMSHDVVMSFFRHLFEDCNFAPSTIATYNQPSFIPFPRDLALILTP